MATQKEALEAKADLVARLEEVLRGAKALGTLSDGGPLSEKTNANVVKNIRKLVKSMAYLEARLSSPEED